MSLSLLSRYSSAKSFIEDEYRQTHIIQKTEYLNEFIITIQNNPSVLLEYDEDREVQEYLDELMKEKENTKND